MGRSIERDSRRKMGRYVSRRISIRCMNHLSRNGPIRPATDERCNRPPGVSCGIPSDAYPWKIAGPTATESNRVVSSASIGYRSAPTHKLTYPVFSVGVRENSDRRQGKAPVVPSARGPRYELHPGGVPLRSVPTALSCDRFKRSVWLACLLTYRRFREWRTT